MYEMTMPDPIETTVPDPIERRPGLCLAHRRAIELAVLVLLVPAYLVTRWIDFGEQAAHRWKRPEKVTVVPRAAVGVLSHSRWKMLGRDTHAPLKSVSTPAGAVQLTLLLLVRPLDAQGVKEVEGVVYQVRDRAGHVWSASGTTGGTKDPVAGQLAQVTVTADVPERLVSAVVLEVWSVPPLGTKAGVPVRVLRFAH